MTDLDLTPDELAALQKAETKRRVRDALARADRKIAALRSQLADAERARAELLDPPVEPVPVPAADTSDTSDSDDGGTEPEDGTESDL